MKTSEDSSNVRASCGDPDAFASHLNTHAFLMGRSAFTINLLTHNILALSSMGPAFLTASECSATVQYEAGQDCASRMEQCSIGCIHHLHPDWLRKARCVVAADNTMLANIKA